jgi:hypothetical protein
VDAAHVPGQLQVDIQDIDADFYSGEHIFFLLPDIFFTPRSSVWKN